MANQTIWDDPYYRWQQQLLNGANIANTGWQTALGLMIGTGLGNWLGHQFGNWQQARDERFQNQINPQATQAAAQNLFGNEFDLGWKPQQNPYQFSTANETFANATRYNPNWRQNLFGDVVNRYQQNLSPPNQYQFPSQNILSGVGYNPPYQSPLLSTNYLQQNLTPQPNYNFNNWSLWRR